MDELPNIPRSKSGIAQQSLNLKVATYPFMPAKDFELTIICSQDKSQEVIETIGQLGIEFDIKEERAFAPPSTDVAIQILVAFVQLAPLITLLVKKLMDKKARIEFETRRRLAERTLSHLKPLYCISGKDTHEYSRYEFKTAKCKYFWELDRGEVTYGPLGCS